MKNYCLLLSFLFLLSLAGSAQQRSALIGKWEFDDIKPKTLPKKKDDSLSYYLSQSFHMGNIYLFAANGRYRLKETGFAQEGDWELSDTGNTIKKITGGIVYEMHLTKLNDHQLIIDCDYGDHPYFLIMKRISLEAADTLSKLVHPEWVSTTPETLAKKWYLKRSEDPMKTAEELKEFEKQCKGAFLDLHRDGTMQFIGSGAYINCGWAFAHGNKAILFTYNKLPHIWNIQKITEKELHLNMEGSNTVWIFSIKK